EKGVAMGERVHVWVQRFKDRPTLVLQWHDPTTGKRKSKSAGTADMDAAERIRADLEYELSKGLYKEPCKMPWLTFRTLFEEEKVAGYRPNTRGKISTVLDALEERMAPGTLGDVTERVLSRHAAELRKEGRKEATIRTHLAY